MKIEMKPTEDYATAARAVLTPEAADRYAAGDMAATDAAGHDAIASEVERMTRKRTTNENETPPDRYIPRR